MQITPYPYVSDLEPADIPLATQYYSYISSGNAPAAATFLSQNPTLIPKIFNAVKLNQLADGIMTLEEVVYSVINLETEISSLAARITALENRDASAVKRHIEQTFTAPTGVMVRDMAVGTIISLPETTGFADYRIIQQGSPDATLYTVGFAGNTWVERVEPMSNMTIWDSTNNDYASSNIFPRVNDNLDPLFADMVQVRIPFKPGTGVDPREVANGNNGLTCHAFLLSITELNLVNSNYHAFGSPLEYYKTSVPMSNVSHWSRTPVVSNDTTVALLGNRSISGASVIGEWRYIPTFILRGDYIPQ